MDDHSRPARSDALRAFLRTTAGWIVFQVVEFVLLLWFARTFYDDSGISWNALLLLLVVVVTIVNYRIRTRWLARDEPSDP